MMPSKDWVLFICILSGPTECDRTKVQELTPLELKSASSSFVARSPAKGRQTPPPAAPGKTDHRVPPQLRGLGASGVAGVGAGGADVRQTAVLRFRGQRWYRPGRPHAPLLRHAGCRRGPSPISKCRPPSTNTGALRPLPH